MDSTPRFCVSLTLSKRARAFRDLSGKAVLLKLISLVSLNRYLKSFHKEHFSGSLKDMQFHLHYIKIKLSETGIVAILNHFSNIETQLKKLH